MNAKRALVTDYVHPQLIADLQERGYEVDYNRTITLAGVAKVIHLYHGIIVNSKIKMMPTMIDKATQLQWIGRLGSGLEIIDVDYATKKGIKVMNTPEGNRNAVAEHAVGMLLNLANNLSKGDREVRKLDWRREENRGWELKGKTVGIIGLGHTGSKLAKKLSSWELTILSYDKYKEDTADELPFVERVRLADILEHADIISLHLPLTHETTHMVDKSFLEKCKKGAIIVNTSRGAVVDTSALVQALESGHLGGACLDVFENEKPNTYSKAESNTYKRLYACEHVIVSPHVAGWTSESLARIAKVMIRKLDASI